MFGGLENFENSIFCEFKSTDIVRTASVWNEQKIPQGTSEIFSHFSIWIFNSSLQTTAEKMFNSSLFNIN